MGDTGSSGKSVTAPPTELIVGVVTEIQDTFGMISGDVFFLFSNVKGDMPKLGSKVMVEAFLVVGMPKIKFNAKLVQIVSQDFLSDHQIRDFHLNSRSLLPLPAMPSSVGMLKRTEANVGSKYLSSKCKFDDTTPDRHHGPTQPLEERNPSPIALLDTIEQGIGDGCSTMKLPCPNIGRGLSNKVARDSHRNKLVQKLTNCQAQQGSLDRLELSKIECQRKELQAKRRALELEMNKFLNEIKRKPEITKLEAAGSQEVFQFQEFKSDGDNGNQDPGEEIYETNYDISPPHLSNDVDCITEAVEVISVPESAIGDVAKNPDCNDAAPRILDKQKLSNLTTQSSMDPQLQRQIRNYQARKARKMKFRLENKKRVQQGLPEKQKWRGKAWRMKGPTTFTNRR